MNRKQLVLSLLVFVGLILTTSCKKEDTSGGTAPAGKSMSATIDGTNWSTGLITSVKNGNGAVVSGTGTGIGIVFNMEDISPGSYSLDSVSTVQLTNTNGTYFGIGKLEITKNDGSTFDGTFSFTGTLFTGPGSITVTNGKFNNIIVPF